MSAVDRLRQLVDVADPAGTVTVRWLADLLKDETGASATTRAPRDLTLDEVCRSVRRAPSTVRGWLQRRELRGYRLNGKAWRVPETALAEYLAAQANAGSESAGDEGDVDIGAWRRSGTTTG